MKLSKQERKRRVFEPTASLVGMNVVPRSIAQPDPPDILCEIARQGQLAIGCRRMPALSPYIVKERATLLLPPSRAYRRGGEPIIAQC